MNESTVLGDPPLIGSVARDPAPLESVLRTELLDRRPWRQPDYKRENQALLKLAGVLSDRSSSILQTLAEAILAVTQADSAGLSLVTKIDGEDRFYWPAIAGMWRPHVGGGTPRHWGPCGDVLDRDAPLLFCYPERRYTYLRPVMPPAVECLLVPFHSGGTAVGTVWAIAHDDHRKFDREDERLMGQVATFASMAYEVFTRSPGQAESLHQATAHARRLSHTMQAPARGALTESLSPREMTVLSLLASGFSYGDVAARLSVTTKTVETYRARAAKKLGLRNRADLVAYALRAGILRGGDAP